MNPRALLERRPMAAMPVPPAKHAVDGVQAIGGARGFTRPIVRNTLCSSGPLLSDSVPAFPEPLLNRDFSAVRVRAGARASLSAAAADDFVGQEQTAPTNPRQPTSTAPSATSPGPESTQECAYPTNFTLAPGKDSGKYDIHMDIKWESSTGRPLDLKYCDTREFVTTDPAPNPPFTETPDSPYIKEAFGFKCAGGDTHRSNLDTGLSRPIAPGTMVSHQVYQFKCRDCYETWTDFPNNRYTITREIFEYGNPSRWRFCVTKAGVNNDYYYSRQVDVPE